MYVSTSSTRHGRPCSVSFLLIRHRCESQRLMLMTAMIHCITDMINIFEVFLPQLLRYPNPNDPLNGEAAALLMRHPKEYEAKVKGWWYLLSFLYHSSCCILHSSFESGKPLMLNTDATTVVARQNTSNDSRPRRQRTLLSTRRTKTKMRR